MWYESGSDDAVNLNLSLNSYCAKRPHEPWDRTMNDSIPPQCRLPVMSFTWMRLTVGKV